MSEYKISGQPSNVHIEDISPKKPTLLRVTVKGHGTRVDMWDLYQIIGKLDSDAVLESVEINTDSVVFEVSR